MLKSMYIYLPLNLYQTTRIITLMLALLALTLPLSANAKIYKWVDDKGNTHYSTEKPADAQAESIKVKLPPNYGGPEEPSEEPTEEKKQGEEKAEEKPKPALEVEPKLSKKQKAEYCKQAKDRVQLIVDSNRLHATDEKGQRTLLNEKQRQARLKDARKDVKEYCR